MDFEKELETVQRFIHNERPASDVTRSLELIEDRLRDNKVRFLILLLI